MKRSQFVVAVAAVLAASLLVPLAGTAAGPTDVTCPQDTMQFTGTAHDLVVPAGGSCQITGATITHDLIQHENAGADILNTSIGHDVVFEDEAAPASRTRPSGTTSSRPDSTRAPTSRTRRSATTS